jgi:hypothetical protein
MTLHNTTVIACEEAHTCMRLCRLQELLCTLMFGILQSRQVSVWRGFFSAVGDISAWVPVTKQHLQTGPCSSVWVRLPPEKQPQQPCPHINLVFFHGRNQC